MIAAPVALVWEIWSGDRDIHLHLCVQERIEIVLHRALAAPGAGNFCGSFPVWNWMHKAMRHTVSGSSTPGGLWSIDLGTITTSQACFEIPPSSTFRIVGVNDNGAADTTTITWTNNESLALGTFPHLASRLDAGPTTTAFVPANAAGWSVSLPSGSLTAQPSACSP